MNGTRRRRIALLPLAVGLFALAAIQALSPAARGRGEDAATHFYEGTHIFRRILFELHLEPLRDFNRLALEYPGDTLLVILGRTDRLREMQGGLQLFLDRGGAVLVASDETSGETPDDNAARQLRQATGVSVSGHTFTLLGPRTLTPDSPPLYRNLDYCPVLQPEAGASPDLFRNPDPGGRPLRVATNVPSNLIGDRRDRMPDGIRPLARLPGFYVESPDLIWRNPLFAVGGRVGKAGGRILLLADHSIFINEMMLPGNIGNVEFTYNCLGWLQETGRPGRRGRPLKRDKVLFLEEGIIRTDFNLPLKEVPDLPPEAISSIVAQLQERLEIKIREAEDDEGLSDRLVDWLEDERPGAVRGLMRYTIYGLALVTLLYLCYRLGVRARPSLDYSAPLLADAVARQQGQAAAPLLKQRQEAQLTSGNLWEAAHELARHAFAAAGVPPPPSAANRPRVRSEGNWWRRWAMRRRVYRLWRLAHDPRSVPVSPAALRRLLRDLDELKAALAAGTMTITIPT